MAEREKLSTRPAREDLTDRECTKILGGLIGSLTQMADVETVRRAVRWWADTPEVWPELVKQKDAVRRFQGGGYYGPGGGNMGGGD